MRSFSVINPTPVIFVFPNLFNLETLYTTFCIFTTSVFLIFAFFRQGDGRAVCKRGEGIDVVMIGASTGQREIVACKSSENKKESKPEYPISTLSPFCMKFYATISRPLTHRADRATIAQTKKAKIREAEMDSIKCIVTNT